MQCSISLPADFNTLKLCSPVTMTTKLVHMKHQLRLELPGINFTPCFWDNLMTTTPKISQMNMKTKWSKGNNSHSKTNAQNMMIELEKVGWFYSFSLMLRARLCVELALLEMRRALLSVVEVPGLVRGVLGGRAGQKEGRLHTGGDNTMD